MGAGRTHPEDRIDYAVGIGRVAHVGDAVGGESPLCMLHARSSEQWQQAADAIQQAFTVGAELPERSPVFRRRIASIELGAGEVDRTKG